MEPTRNSTPAGLPGEPPPPPPARLPGPRVTGTSRLVAVALVAGIAGLVIGRLSVDANDGDSPMPSSAGVADPSANLSFSPASPAASGPVVPGERVIDVEDLAIVLPGDWTVVRADSSSIEARPPGGVGSVVLDTGRGFGSVEALQDAIIGELRTYNPALEVCGQPTPAAVPGGPPDGSSFALCYTVVSEDGQRSAMASAHIVGVHSPIGTAPANAAWFSYALLGPATEVPDLMDLADTLPPPTWKLYQGP